MDEEIIYSFKEYQERYNSLLEKYFLEYEEIEEIDFIDNEIKNYKICLKLVNFPIEKIFNIFWKVEPGTNLKTFSIPQETFDFIFANENEDYYSKIYNNLVAPAGIRTLNKDVEKKIKQVRLMFPKIISFLETKKSEFETNLKKEEKIILVKNKKIIFDFINNINNKEGFLNELRITFPTEQGKSIKAIVLKLVDAEILIYGTKEFLQLYNELKIYFKRDIGTYQSINDIKTVDFETSNIIHKKLNPLISKYKTI